MNESRKKEIYLEECGSECPMYEPCPHCKNGVCTLDEPWFDCDDFAAENADDMYAAVSRIDDEINCEEGNESEDSYTLDDLGPNWW